MSSLFSWSDRENNDIRCFHVLHSGIVGRKSTEWAVTCPNFEDTGEVGYIEKYLVRGFEKHDIYYL